MKPKEIAKDIYLVGNSDMTDPKDCSVYLLDLGDLVLIDTGSGTSVNAIIKNIEDLGLDPEKWIYCRKAIFRSGYFSRHQHYQRL